MKVCLLLYHLVLSSVLGIVLGGCSHEKTSTNRIDLNRLTWACSAMNELARMGSYENKQIFFSDIHLKAMIGGEPELITKMSDLPSLLKEDAKEDSETIDQLMEDLYHHYKGSLTLRLRVDTNTKIWRSPERFNNLEVWLYNFSDPPQIWIGGLLPKKSGIFDTDCFMLENRNVVAHGSLHRKLKHKR